MRGFILHQAELSPIVWDSFIGNCAGASVCAQHSWWASVAPDWQAVIVTDEVGIWLAALPFKSSHKWCFLTISTPPPWTPYTGPYIRRTALTGYAKTQLLHQIWNCIIQTLPKTILFQFSLPPGVSWVNELKTTGFKIIPRITYMADFQNNVSFPNAQQQFAHKLRQAKRQNFSVQPVGIASVEQLLNFPENQQKYSAQQLIALKKLLLAFHNQPAVGLYSTDNELIAINWSPAFTKVRLNILTLSNPILQTSRATTGFLLMQQLSKSQENQELFDFEGSEIPGVENFYRRFGFETVVYFVATKYTFSRKLPKWI